MTQTMIEWASELMLAAESECRIGNEDMPFQIAAWQIAKLLRELLSNRQELQAMQAEFGDAIREKAAKQDLVRNARHVWLRPGQSITVEEGEPVVIVPHGHGLSLLDQVDPAFGGQDAYDIVHGMARRRAG